MVLRMNAARSPRAAGGASDVGEPARRMCVKPGRTGCGRRKNSKRAAKVTKTGGRVTVGQGVGGEGILQVARRRSRLKTATGSRIGAITATRSRSGASDSRGRSGVVLNFILCLPSRHSLESRACCYEGSLGSAVVTAAACATKRGTGSAGKQTVRRSCARKVGCRLLARM